MYSIDIFVLYVNKKVKYVEGCRYDPEAACWASKIAAENGKMSEKRTKTKKGGDINAKQC